MSITDELREWWVRKFPVMDEKLHKDFTAIADRIDERHAKERIKVYDKGVHDGIDADKDAMGYVKLPVDADGVPIRIGDTVKLGDGTFEVRRLELYDMDSWDVLDRFGEPFSPFYMRHVQPDTWEHIIEDAAKLARGDNDAVMELVERCRRLAGDA